MRYFDESSWWKQLFEHSPDPCWIIQDERFVLCNQAAVHALGYSNASELLNLRPEELSPEFQLDGESSAAKAEHIFIQLRQQGILRFEWVHRKKDGTDFPVEVTLSCIEVDVQSLVYCAWRDISERLETRLRLEDSEQHFRTLANSGTTLIWTSGTDKLCNYFNEPWLRFTGRTFEQEYGNGWAEGVHPDDFEMCLKIYVESFDQRIPFSMIYRLRNREGEYRWLRDDGHPRYDTRGRFLGYIGHCMDVTHEKEAEEKIRSMAFFDYLTGLPNRRMLVDRLDKALTKGERHEHHGALLFLDLDGFKAINDAFGHDRGDQLLQQTAKRLLACIRQGDTVSRHGGDEFIVLLELLDPDPARSCDQARAVGEKILRVLAEPYQIDGQSAHCTVSIGLVLFKGNAKTAGELLREADQQMYRSKLAGKGVLCC